MDLNVLIRGQSNALLFADRGGAAALERGLEARLGVDVHLLYEFGTDSSTIHSATPFMTWDTEGQQASLLRYVVSAAYRPFSGLLDGRASLAVAQCQGMSSSMRLCGHPLTRRVSTSAK